jgi:hypothetical protein
MLLPPPVVSALSHLRYVSFALLPALNHYAFRIETPYLLAGHRRGLAVV